VLSRARKQDVYSKENPERIIGDEGNFDKYPDKREHRNYKRKGEYRMLCAPPSQSSWSRKHLGDSGDFVADGVT
jgi:hypothetical protein